MQIHIHALFTNTLQRQLPEMYVVHMPSFQTGYKHFEQRVWPERLREAGSISSKGESLHLFFFLNLRLDQKAQFIKGHKSYQPGWIGKLETCNLHFQLVLKYAFRGLIWSTT